MQIAKKINEFEQTISEYLVQKIPVEINFQDFLSSIFEKVDESKQKVEFKLKSLFYFVKSHKNVTNEYCLITNKDLSFELKKIMTDADINNCYIHQNSFDLLFESYSDLKNLPTAGKTCQPYVKDTLKIE